MAALELAEELVVEVVPVGQDHHRGVGHRGVTDDRTSVEQHRQALAAALGVPDHPSSTIARGAAVHPAGPVGAGVALSNSAGLDRAAGPHGLMHRGVHRVELVVAGHDLVQ